MSDDVFRWVIAIGVLLSVGAFVVQTIMVVFMFRVTKGMQDKLTPIIDATGPHCWIATGHFKNGILLGPGTARAVSQWMLGSEPPLDLSPFRLARFAVSTVS